jgi:LysM repeat protein
VWALALSACVALRPVPVPVAPVVAPAPLAPLALIEPVDAGVIEGVDAGVPPVEDDDSPTAAGEGSEDGPADFAPPEVLAAATDGGYHYTADLSDDELAQRWEQDPKSLGSISIGFAEEGRLINAMPFPEGEAWTVVIPESCWTTQETADAIIGAARQVRAWYPEGAPVRVGQVSGPEGGYLPPHITHQNGRDVDVGLFYPGPEPYRIKEREKVMDVPMNWAFAKAMLMNGDVQFILLDRRVQKVLYDYALAHGEDKQWLDSLFHAGPRSVFFHARKHRDHFHVRLYNPRAMELAHRLAPLMPKRPEENVAFYRVVKGDTLSGIAHKMGSSVKTLMTANHLSSSFLRLRQVLKVPLRGPCTNCPVPPLVTIPARHLPPPASSSDATSAARSPRG